MSCDFSSGKDIVFYWEVLGILDLIYYVCDMKLVNKKVYEHFNSKDAALKYFGLHGVLPDGREMRGHGFYRRMWRGCRGIRNYGWQIKLTFKGSLPYYKEKFF